MPFVTWMPVMTESRCTTTVYVPFVVPSEAVATIVTVVEPPGSFTVTGSDSVCAPFIVMLCTPDGACAAVSVVFAVSAGRVTV